MDINAPGWRVERLGAAGRRRVLDVFSTERYVAGVTEVYERLLGR